MLNENLVRTSTSLLQYFLISIDVLANVLSDFSEINLFVRLSFYIVQDVSLLVSLIILILLLFQKHILINKQLKYAFLYFIDLILLILIYLILTFILQSIIITSNEKHLLTYKIKNKIVYLYIIQRLLAVFYYVKYKLTSDLLLNQRFIQIIKNRN